METTNQRSFKEVNTLLGFDCFFLVMEANKKPLVNTPELATTAHKFRLSPFIGENSKECCQ